MEKKCSGGIVINNKGEILLTKQIDSDLSKAKEILNGLKEKGNNNILEIMKSGDCGFTKGKIEEGDKKLEIAIKEIGEEGGIPASNIKKIGKLGFFHKKKKYGSKKITMFLFETQKECELKPTDERHISGRFDINTALKIIKTKEKNFLLKNISNIENYKKNNI